MAMNYCNFWSRAANQEFDLSLKDLKDNTNCDMTMDSFEKQPESLLGMLVYMKERALLLSCIQACQEDFWTASQSCP